MIRLRSLAVLAVALFVTNPADAAKAKKTKPVKGEVVEVKKDADAETGSLVVKIAANTKKGIPESQRTFKVTATTKVLKLEGKKAKNATTTDAKFSEVPQGAIVTVTASTGDEASEIKFAPAKKKKNK